LTNKQNDRKGLVQVYTGSGKGKTTAALGLALRASGHGLKVVVIQFLKSCQQSGECQIIDQYPIFRLLHPNTEDHFLQATSQLEATSGQALTLAQNIIASGEADMVVLDEVFHSLHKRFISLEEVQGLIANKPKRMELILTGRNAPTEIIRMADLVTEMLAIKHPLAQGIPARQGTEF